MMKKTVKSLFIFMIMAILLVGMTGCGKEKTTKKDENSNLVATKSGEDSTFGKYEERIEISFKDKKADKIVMTRDLEDEEIAKNLEKVISYLNTEEGIKFEVEGKKIIITFNADAYATEEGLDEEGLTRDSLKEELEKAGYTVE